MTGGPETHWLRRYRRALVLVALACVMAVLQAIIYPVLYSPTLEELYQQTSHALARGDYQTTVRLAAALHRRVPNHDISQFLAGWAQHCTSNYAAALRAYHAAIQHVPDYAQSYANAGYILHELGRDDEALEMFRAHLAREPDSDGSRAMLQQLEQRTAAPRPVMFHSASNYYFCSRGIDTHWCEEFHRSGRYRAASSEIDTMTWLRRGRWRQESNGLIRLVYRLPHADNRDEECFAGVWVYRGVTFACEEPTVKKLLRERDGVARDIDAAGKDAFRRGISRAALPVSRVEYAARTGGINIILGELAGRGVVPLPFWLLRSVRWLCSALWWLVPMSALVAAWRIRPRVPCPACGTLAGHGRLRGLRRVRCRRCKATVTLPCPIPWRVRLAVSGADLALLVWFVHETTTVSSWPLLLRLLLLAVVLGVGYDVRVRLYARWLCAHVAHK